jgi:hypothetical protein
MKTLGMPDEIDKNIMALLHDYLPWLVLKTNTHIPLLHWSFFQKKFPEFQFPTLDEGLFSLLTKVRLSTKD